ncbi:MAG: 3-keto-disaccharide hydrolase [Robiginitalea sp.]
MNKVLLSLCLVTFFVSCKPDSKKIVNTENSPAESAENEWITLFDGASLDGWRGYNMDSLPPGWVIEDGAIAFNTELGLEQDYQGGVDILYGKEEFDNFELYLEWKLPEGGNSGIFYHVKEGYNSVPEVAPEYQLIDDVNYARIHDLTEDNLSLGHTENPGELRPLQTTGADYAMHPPDPGKTLHPVGEWNSSRIVFTPERVEHWLNGEMIVSFVPWDEEWEAKKASDKWKLYPDYGKFKKGYIALQDHSSPIWFRNIKIKKL